MADLKVHVGLGATDNLTGPLQRAAGAAGNLKGATTSTGRGLDKVAAIAKRTGKSADSMAGPMREAAAKVRQLEQSSKDLDQFRKLKDAAKTNADALAAAEKRAQDLGRAMNQGEGQSKQAAAAFAKAEKEVQKLKTAHQAAAGAVDKQRDKLKAAGVATANLDKAQEDLKRQLAVATDAAEKQAAALEKARARAQRLAKTKDQIKGLGRAFVGAAGAAGRLTRSIGGMLGPLGALGGLASVAGLGHMVTNFAKSSDELSKFGRQVGFTAEGLQELQYASDRQGVSQETFNASIRSFGKRLGELKGGGGALASYLKKTNPALAAQLKTAQSSEEAFSLMMVALEKIEDPQKRAAMAAAAFSNSGAAMTRVAEAGSEGLAALREDARKLGIVVGNDTAAAAEGFVDSMTRFQASADGLGKAISSRLMPVVQPMIDRLTEWVIANREVLATRLDGMIKRVAETLGKIDFERIVAGLSSFADTISTAVDWVGGWENAMIGVVVMMNGGLIGGIATLASSLIGLATAAFPLVVSGFTAVSAASGLTAASIKAAGIAVMTSPIFWAIAAIAGAAFLLYTYWTPIKAFVTDLWERVSAIVSGAWDRLKALFFQFHPLGIIIANWGPITTYLQGLWDRAGAIVSGAWDRLKALFFQFHPVGIIASNWGPITEYFTGLWDQVMGIFDRAWTFIQAKLAAVKAPLQWLGDKLGGLFGGDDPPPGQSRSLARAAAMVATPRLGLMVTSLFHPEFTFTELMVTVSLFTVTDSGLEAVETVPLAISTRAVML